MRPGLTIPRATYRLQFHRGFTLRDALECVPYLSALGVSHLYASPLLKARPGSTHGYDVCLPTHLNPELGTETDLEALVLALRERGMGLVLDIVPNHQGIGGPENPGWWDVLKHGRQSRFADHFDIDWDVPDPRRRNKVLLPVLGDECERVLERRELAVVREDAEITVRYFEHRFPVNPESLAELEHRGGTALSALDEDPEAMARFLDQQHYQLVCWRHGDTQLNYRRFFTITHLAGVRVELPRVFADTHARILDWHQRGLLDGLRIDHPDGLRDPHAYLDRLDRAAPDAWITVEKILEPGEDLPPDWPVAGTTGYDFLGRVTGLFIDPQGERPLTEFYAEFTGEPIRYAPLVRAKKRWILEERLSTEVSWLTRLLLDLASGDDPRACFTVGQLRQAQVELVAGFPVYRTYLRPGQPPSEADVAVVETSVATARSERPDLSAALDYLRELLLFRVRPGQSEEWVLRFQQLTGPAMAKGVEDTAYYCFNRFVALNEVGGDPAQFGLDVEMFHRACGHARQHWPHAMLATSTHDTKRSEDVRTRLALLSEIPDPWTAAVRRWSAMNEKYRRTNWPDRNAEYLLYQTLVGAWPLPVDRAVDYMEKAAREANQHTNWIDRNADYESASRDFVVHILGDPGFADELERFVTPLIGAGQLNSLAQTLLKLTTPGVPDLYQGTDLWDLSLVDPDNRRPVDFAERRDALGEIARRLSAVGKLALGIELLLNQADGRIKLFVIHQTLELRRQHEPLFRDGDYVPLRASGNHAKHVCAFARTLDGTTVLTVVPRLILGLTARRDCRPIGVEVWEDTLLDLPRAHAGRSFRNVFTDEVVDVRADGAAASLRLADLLATFPVALWVSLDPPVQSAAQTLPPP